MTTDFVNPIVAAPSGDAVTGAFMRSFATSGMRSASRMISTIFYDAHEIAPFGMLSTARMQAGSFREITNFVNALPDAPNGDAVNGAFLRAVAPSGMRSAAYCPAMLHHYIWAQAGDWAQGMEFDRNWELIAGQKLILPLSWNLLERVSVPASWHLLGQISLPVSWNLMDSLTLAISWRLGSGRISVPVSWHLKERKSIAVSWHLKEQKSVPVSWNLLEQLSLAIGWYLIGYPELEISGDPIVFEISGDPEIFEIQ